MPLFSWSRNSLLFWKPKAHRRHYRASPLTLTLREFHPLHIPANLTWILAILRLRLSFPRQVFPSGFATSFSGRLFLTFFTTAGFLNKHIYRVSCTWVSSDFSKNYLLSIYLISLSIGAYQYQFPKYVFSYGCREVGFPKSISVRFPDSSSLFGLKAYRVLPRFRAWKLAVAKV